MTAETQQQAFHKLGDASFYMTDYHFNETDEKCGTIHTYYPPAKAGHGIMYQVQPAEGIFLSCKADMRLTAYSMQPCFLGANVIITRRKSAAFFFRLSTRFFPEKRQDSTMKVRWGNFCLLLQAMFSGTESK